MSTRGLCNTYDCRKYGKRAFEVSNSDIRVIIPFNEEVLINHGTINGTISGVDREELDDKEKMILDMLTDNSRLTTKVPCSVLNIPFRSVQRYITNLKEKGFIERTGANKNGYWKVLK